MTETYLDTVTESIGVVKETFKKVDTQGTTCPRPRQSCLTLSLLFFLLRRRHVRWIEEQEVNNTELLLLVLAITGGPRKKTCE